MTRGKITLEYWVSCGVCDGEECLATGRRPGAEARRRGWVLTKSNGWAHDKCVKKTGGQV